MKNISVEKGILKVVRKVVHAEISRPSFVMFENKHIEEIVTPKMQEKKKKKTSWIFLLINVLIVGGILIYTLLTQETKPLSTLLAENPYYRFLWLSLGVMVVFYVAEGLCYSLLLKQTTGKFSFGLGIKTALVGKYWDSITPFGSGGQIMQITYLNGKEKGADVSTSVIVGKYLLFQIAYTMIGLTVVIVPYDFLASSAVIKYMALVGVILNTLVFAFILLVSTNRKACSVLVVGGLKLLAKLKIIKNYQQSLINSLKFIKNYQNSMKHFIKKPFLILAEVLLNIISLVCVAFVAYLIYKVFNPFGNIGAIKIITMSFLCTFATTFIPIPGGSGAAEVSFVAMFSQLFTSGTTFWALMFWRFFTYYLFIIAGFSLTIFEPIFIKAREKKLLRNEKNTL